MSNPRVINKRGGGRGKTDGEIALFLRGFPHCVGVCGSSFSFALQFPLVRVCFRPTFRLAFAPSGVLMGLILSAVAFAIGGGPSFPSVLIPPHFLSSTDCSGLPSLVASWNFLTKFHQGGAGDLSLFSGLRVRTPAILAQSIL